MFIYFHACPKNPSHEKQNTAEQPVHLGCQRNCLINCFYNSVTISTCAKKHLGMSDIWNFGYTGKSRQESRIEIL